MVGPLKVVPERDFKCQIHVSEVNTHRAHIASMQAMHKKFSREVIWIACVV